MSLNNVSCAEAVFASTLQPSQVLSKDVIATAVREGLAKCGGVSGCEAIIATEYGEHPDAAPSRMRWALELVEDVQLCGSQEDC